MFLIKDWGHILSLFWLKKLLFTREHNSLVTVRCAQFARYHSGGAWSMAALLLPLNSCSTTSIRNPNFSSLQIKINQRHSPFQTLRNRRAPFVRALEQDSNPETVQGSLSFSLKVCSANSLAWNLILTVKIVFSDGEVNNLGVKAALSMLRFYKSNIFFLFIISVENLLMKISTNYR